MQVGPVQDRPGRSEQWRPGHLGALRHGVGNDVGVPQQRRGPSPQRLRRRRLSALGRRLQFNHAPADCPITSIASVSSVLCNAGEFSARVP